MELKNTIKMMVSDDYKERFKAEYWQTKIRADKLHKMLVKLETGKLNFKPTCPKDILVKQLRMIDDYANLLELRASYENIDLEDINTAKVDKIEPKTKIKVVECKSLKELFDKIEKDLMEAEGTSID